ncbi:MAG: glycosyl transferase [Synechococcales bacterium]|nr:glycosyl transferase [Synechococcales bacterium]
MPHPILYVAITNHGFGHATRTASVVAEIQRQCPDILVILVTTAPRWLLESYLPGEFIHRPRSFDVGVIQSDSVTMDKAATLEKLQHIQAQASQIIAGEVSFIQQNRVGLVLADIPPLATRIAQAAGIPCWMMSNFGWDFIYRDWGGPFREVADWISSCFQGCDRLFRLPFHEPMAAFPVIEDVGLTGGSPNFSEAELRQHFQITAPTERVVLMTFGGLGLSQIPYEGLAAFPDWQFITFDRQAPRLPNLVQITDNRYRPVDFMPWCSRLISKPGYGTFSEACRLGTPVISITRDDFAEAPVLLDGLRRAAHHRILPPEELLQGDWAFLTEPLHPPEQPGAIATDGNDAIARAVIDYFHR